MAPDIAYPVSISPATGSLDPADFPLDIARMRGLCARSEAQNPDDEFRSILHEAIDDIESMHGLKIRPGQFSARFPLQAPVPAEDRGAAWSTGRPAQALGQYAELALPGVSCELVSLELDGSGGGAAAPVPVAHGDPRSDHGGNLFVPPPADTGTGWDLRALAGAGGRPLERLAIVAVFRAGGTAAKPVPAGVRKALGLRALWHLNDEPEDADAALRQGAMYGYRQDW